jgi:hypothetical protein
LNLILVLRRWAAGFLYLTSYAALPWGSIPILIKTSLKRNCGLYLDCNDTPWVKPDIGYTIIEQPIVREGMRRAGRAVHVLEIDNFAR